MGLRSMWHFGRFVEHGPDIRFLSQVILLRETNLIHMAFDNSVVLFLTLSCANSDVCRTGDPIRLK